MPGKPNIRWGKSDAEKLTRMVERFNNKIYRVKRNHPEIADIQPETIKKADKAQMIEEFKSMPRSEFNKKMNELERYTRKGAEKEIVSATGNRVTSWEKKEVAYQVQQINRQRAIERKKVEEMEATTRGQPIGLKRGEMGSERLNALNPVQYDFDKKRPGKEWKSFKNSLRKQANINAAHNKNELHKMNYIKALTKVGGEYAAETIEKLKQLPADTVTDIYYREQEATIDFVYELQELDTILSVVDDIWEKAFSENDELVGYQNWSEAKEVELLKWILDQSEGKQATQRMSKENWNEIRHNNAKLSSNTYGFSGWNNPK